ncbi:ABC transporter ATP-binding protein uup [compost metagenome]
MEVNENDRVLDVVKNIADYIEMANGEVITASQLLTHFLFPPEKQFGFVNKLSGGEKKRLQLMRVLMKNPNFLILDEPSNDLDIDTLNVLEDFLDNYKGVLILVSHDRYLLDKLTDQLFIFEGKGSVQIYNGNYADFKLEQDEIQKLEKEKQKRITQEQVKPIVKEEKKKLSYKEQLEYTKLEEEIEKLETQVTLKTEKLNQETDHLKLSSLAEEIQSIQTQIDDKSERWLYLADFM